MRVNLPHAGRSLIVLRTTSCLLIGAICVHAQDKVIRLRNETIATPPKAAGALQPQVAEPPATGLFLVQFDDQIQPAWRERLHQMRVELVRYVPDDAFIAQFSGANPGQVKRLPFVRWIGAYRPD